MKSPDIIHRQVVEPPTDARLGFVKVGAYLSFDVSARPSTPVLIRSHLKEVAMFMFITPQEAV